MTESVTWPSDLNFADRRNCVSGSQSEQRILIWIVVVGLGLRLYGIGFPFLDGFAERQAQVAIVARNLFLGGMNLLCPRLDIFGSGRECVIFEFPLAPALAAAFYYIFGEHEMIGRLVNVIFSAAAMIVFYHLARQFLSAGPALYALALYAFSPMNIYFSRAFTGEASLMLFSVLAVYLFLRWLDRPRPAYYLGSALSIALALLTKPTSAVLLGPVLVAWLLRQGWHIPRRADFWLYLSMAVGPFIVWASYANYVNAQNLDMPASWHWISAITDRGGIFAWWVSPHFYLNMGFSIILVLLTPVGFLGLLAGLWVARPNWQTRVLYVWLATVVVSFYALAGANVGHPYYQLPLLPVAAILFGCAVDWLFNHSATGDQPKISNRVMRYTVGAGAGFIVLGYAFGYYVFHVYPHLYVWLAALIASLYTFATPSVGRSYFQLLVLLVAAVLFGYAVRRLFRRCTFWDLVKNKKMARYAAWAAGATIVLGHGIGYYVFYWYMYNTSYRMGYVPAVAKLIREETPPNSVLILNQPKVSHTVLTYYAQRPSWYLCVKEGGQAIRDLETLRSRGGTTFVTVDTRYASGMAETKRNELFWRYLNETYTPIAVSEHYAVFDLRQPGARDVSLARSLFSRSHALRGLGRSCKNSATSDAWQ